MATSFCGLTRYFSLLSKGIMTSSLLNRLFVSMAFLSPIGFVHSADLGAHLHGHAELLIAIEGEYVDIQLTSPAANILGFEHAPRNAEQRKRIQQAQSVLEHADTLFQFRKTKCQSIMANVQFPFSADTSNATEHNEHDNSQHDGDHHENHHDGHGEDKHSGHHDDGHHDDHHAEKHSDQHHEDGHHDHGKSEHSEHHDDGEHEEAHTEVMADYRFQCTAGAPNSIQTSLLEMFPAIETLETVWVTETKQGAKEVNTSNMWIDFR